MPDCFRNPVFGLTEIALDEDALSNGTLVLRKFRNSS